ncbi:hypothetical protein ACOMHN_021979 [Nucella lapillus]
MNAIDFYIFWTFFSAVIPPRFQAIWTLFLLHLVSFLWYQPAPCLQQLSPSFFSPALSYPLHYSSPPPPAPVPSVYPLRHYPPPLPSPPSSNLPMRYSRDQLLEIQPSTPNFELVNHLRELRLGVGLPRKRGCRGGRKKLRSIQVVPSRNLHPLMVPPFLQPHPDLQSAVGNAPLSSKHPTQLPTTDCLLSIIPLMGGQPSEAPALSPRSSARAGWSIQQRPCSLASITTATGRSTHCPGTLCLHHRRLRMVNPAMPLDSRPHHRHCCCVLCGEPCDETTDAITSIHRWESIKKKAQLWSGFDKFGDVYTSIIWDNGPDGQYVHNSCVLTLSNARKLEQAKNRQKKRAVDECQPHSSSLSEVSAPDATPANGLRSSLEGPIHEKNKMCLVL